ncbi:MAG: methyltransferase domain-containing protein [Candidatus Bathyarchaeia archaeon]
MPKTVSEYFESIALDFDSYYEQPKGLVNKIVNNWLRKPGLIKRMEITLELIKPSAGKRILDVGCGSGKLAVECAKRGAEVYGIDISKNMIEIAKDHCKKEKVKVELMVGDALQGLPKNFDFSVALGVLEYLERPKNLLENMLASVKNEGKVIFSVPSLYAFQTPIRRVYLHFRGVNCYFYTRKKLLNLIREFQEVGSVEIHSYGPGFVVQLTKI